MYATKRKPKADNCVYRFYQRNLQQTKLKFTFKIMKKAEASSSMKLNIYTLKMTKTMKLSVHFFFKTDNNKNLSVNFLFKN